MKKIAIVSGILLAASAAVNVQAHPTNEGYATTPSDTVWRTGFGGCWRHGFWQADNAIKGCDGYKAPVVAAPNPAPAPAPKAAPAPAPKPAPAPAPEPVVKNLLVKEQHIVYFGYDSAEVKSVAEITDYIGSLTTLKSITLSGHTDKLGSSAYNMALSRKRVDAVADALVAEGVNRNLILTDYSGEATPVKTCEKDTRTCLAENRRVEVTINGIKQVKQ